jgi:hypothetical protein
MANPSTPFPKHKFERDAAYVILNEKGDTINFAYFKLKNSASVNKMLQLLRKIDPDALGHQPNQVVSVYNLRKKQVEFVLVKTNGKFTDSYYGFEKTYAPMDIQYMFTIEPNIKESTINYIHKNMKHIQESASQEAYAIHRMTDSGQDAAQDFIDSNPNLNIKKLISDLSRKLVNKYNVRDVISGVAPELQIKKFMKTYTNKNMKESKITEAKQTNKLTKLIESIIRRTILELKANDAVMFDSNIHKTLEKGAMDFEFNESDPKTIHVFAPFKEELNVMVHMKINKMYFDNLLDSGYIESQEDLDSMLTYDKLYAAVETLMKRPDVLRKYLIK